MNNSICSGLNNTFTQELNHLYQHEGGLEPTILHNTLGMGEYEELRSRGKECAGVDISGMSFKREGTLHPG